MSDYSVKDHIAYKMGFKAGQETQATRIAELEAALATARRDGMEEAAQWHDQQAAKAQKFADMKVSAQDAKVWSDYAQNHREYAAAIRAALEGGKKDER